LNLCADDFHHGVEKTQEENQYLSVPREKVLEYPEHVQRKIGYELSQPYLGWVDLADPLAFLKGEDVTPGDLF
jgi:hypothetical protein